MLVRRPSTVQKIITEIETTGAPGYTEVVCKLLNMSGASHEQFAVFFDKVRKETRKDGRRHDASMSFARARTGITIFSTMRSTYDADLELLKRWLDVKCHRESAQSWLGLLTVVGDRTLIHGWVLAGT